MATTVSKFARAVSITTTAKTLADLGFSAAEISQCNTLHITAYGICLYDYTGNTPAGPNSGHYLEANGDRIIEGKANINAFKIVAASGTVAGYITLSSS